jgi:hypothetical protein
MEAIVEALEQLLPKGIVFDSPSIYREVAKLPVVPVEDIYRHWKTYTTTHKNLQDPTACRLESFWWHVWGSNRRNLSGKTLARLWEQIASGPTFVPLRGPPNRWEPPPKPTQSMHEPDSTRTPQVQDVCSKTPETQSITAKAAVYGLTPSSARPPPAHPILKKPRGPSNSGPRPTARFVGIPESEDEATQKDGEDSVGSSAKKKSESRASSSSISPTKVDRKPAPKKFVASSAASKRRPVLPRRQSSQSSTGSATASEPSPRDTASASRNGSNQQAPNLSSKDSSPTKRPNGSGLPPTEERPSRTKAPGKQSQVTRPGREPTSASSQDVYAQDGPRKAASTNTSSPVSTETSCPPHLNRSQGSSEEKLNAKALGKRPETVALTFGKRRLPQKSIQSGDYDGRQRSPPRSVPQPMQPTTSVANTAGTIESGRKRSAQEGKLPDQKEQGDTTDCSVGPKMARSRSGNEPKRLSSGGLKSASVVGLSNIAVAGGFDFETPKARPSQDDTPPLGAGQPDVRAASILDSRLTPTQPSPNPPPPLGRSKSQLTLVLERERARAGAGTQKSKR